MAVWYTLLEILLGLIRKGYRWKIDKLSGVSLHGGVPL